tara:strand:- start:400 stop:1359 length:960 start_codon:yes stop_codon:yes gene_type:complete
MKSKINVEKSYVLNAPLPNHGQSYTVISHKFVIDNTKQMLANSGFIITDEKYRANGSGEIAQGIYHIKPLSGHTDNEIGMMFAWTNSYDKSIRFQCAIGAHVFACSNGMVCGELNYARKHTGTADQEIRSQISSQIKNAQKAFDRIRDDRDNLRSTDLTAKQQAELLGRMYFNEDLISPRQMSVVKDEMEKPSFDYQCDQENAWAFYNHVTHSYKSVHPRSWLSDTKIFHDFMVANVLNGMGITPQDTINTEDTIEDAPPTIEETGDLIEEFQAEQFGYEDLEEEPKHSLEGIEGGPQFTSDNKADEGDLINEDFDFEI